MPTYPPIVARALRLCRIDAPPAARQPAAGRVAVATVAAVAGSLLADALLVVLGEALFPSTKGYRHFQFGDYAKLTVVGVAFACAGWPIVTRLSSQPRWVFTRLAVVVSAVLLLPDVGILVQGEPAKAVAVLVAMHLAIAVVTYRALVHLAPVPSSRGRLATVRS